MPTTLMEKPKDSPPEKVYDRSKVSEGILKIYEFETFLSSILIQRPILVLPDETYPERTHKTACTDGASIWFHGEFLNTLSKPEAAYVVLHEGLHIALMHRCVVAELRKESTTPVDADLLNYCLDIFVNYLCDKVVLNAPAFFKGPDSRITVARVHKDFPNVLPEGFETMMDSIQVYRVLREQPRPPSFPPPMTVFLIETPSNIPGSLKGGSPEPGDDLEKIIRQVIRQAEVKARQSRRPGDDPGEIEAIVTKLLEPITTLDAFLRTKMLGKSHICRDFNRPARNAAWLSGPGRPIYPRFRKGPWQRAVVIVDTSGSMDLEDIATVLDVTAGILDQARKNHVGTELHLWCCDTKTHELGIFKKRSDLPEKLPIFGRGGTSFQDPINRVMEKARREKWDWTCTTVIYVTDSFGDAENMTNPKIPFVWIVPSTQAKDAEKRLPWGSLLGLFRGKTQLIRR